MTSNEPTQNATPYVTACFHCHTKFDAAVSDWCNCIADESTFVCPHCERCSCKAPADFHLNFWNDAPISLRQRRLDHVKAMLEWENPSPEDVARPAILLVEDDEDVIRIARRVIEGLGFGLVIARDGVEGLALTAQYRPELVLTDALMPRLDGREMCLAIKSSQALAQTKVIVMSAVYKKRQHVSEALREFKADAMLAKPVHVEDLHRLLLTMVAA